MTLIFTIISMIAKTGAQFSVAVGFTSLLPHPPIQAAFKNPESSLGVETRGFHFSGVGET